MLSKSDAAKFEDEGRLCHLLHTTIRERERERW
jgi:hypothetical protein